MTAQEYLDLLLKTSREGGFPAMISTAPGTLVCGYRCSDGKRCAVGLLIPDDEYNSMMEKNSIYENVVRRVVEYCLPEGVGMTDIHDIQYLHDKLAYTDPDNNEYISIPHRQLIPWNHEKWEKKLREMDCFKECV